ncbi:MAG: glycoside hydrolase family 57 protein [Planctomycetaceae bacterium]
MQPVSLAFFWHQHQPYYPDDVTGETLMPWVRLHGTKDYIGMALHIKEVPEFRCTINLVPSLLVQIQRYLNGGSDRHLDVSRLNAAELSEEDAVYLVDNFFMCCEQTMVRPFERYRELYLKRAFGREGGTTALKRFSESDLRDLQVWFNLTWFHELLFEQDSELRKFRKKGRDYTEDEKKWLLDKQMEVLGDIIPLHRELSESGQVELTTTPFYHPILPLLWDKRSCREAMPGCPLPKYTTPYPEDAIEQIRRGVALHKELFGAPPRGMWPSEGSVSNDIVGAILDAGIEWIATDEEILSHSTDGFVHRDGQGHVARPEMLYRPWHVDHDNRKLQMIFRDHGLSDLVGFQYQRNDPHWAADDLLAKVKEIGRVVEGHNGSRPAFVPVILDGENCWEYYPDGGVGFLRQLYQKAASDPLVNPVTVAHYLAEYPAEHRIARLFAGSWINKDFYIWIGHQEDRDAWDLVHQTREFLLKAQKSNCVEPETLERAWKELFIAEGSDWYWWYGDDRSSGQDELFDELFRRHLRNVYTLLDEIPPAALLRPVTKVERRPLHTQPKGLLNVKIDGRYTYFEWLLAGHHHAGGTSGTMAMVSDTIIKDMYFGFDLSQLLLRCDTSDKAIDDLAACDELRIRFVDPYGVEVRVDLTDSPKLSAGICSDGKKLPVDGVHAAIDRIFEIAVPWKSLGCKVGDMLQFAVELYTNGESIGRTPSEGTIELVIPPPDIEDRNWQV